MLQLTSKRTEIDEAETFYHVRDGAPYIQRATSVDAVGRFGELGQN
jgi:hypothetical protein